ncbi:hypothetical protein GCM10008941_01590 [Rhizomicrobium palustre]
MIASVGALRTSVQIAVPNPNQLQITDPNLEAAIQRVATELYMRAHCEVPPDVTDMGGGIFNVIV